MLMKQLLKSYSWLSKIYLLAVICFSNTAKSQSVANYVSNGSFEDYFTYSIYSIPYNWGALDSLKYYGGILRSTSQIPTNYYGYQQTKHGDNYLIYTPYCPTCITNKRAYPKNRLKQILKPSTTYCVTFFVSLTHQSTHGIDAIAAYFGDSSIDTIKKCNDPIVYLSPQIVNSSNNVITDTLNWVAITGTFVAQGNEKYMLIGNFKSDANTNMILTNSTNLPANFTEYYVDAVSCIEVDAPAYAGPDKKILAGDSVYLGRERDFAIDPYCVWYQLPNMSTIDTTSGIYVKPTVTTTYVVKQNLECGSLKWDTVVVNVSYVGLRDVSLSGVEGVIKLFPNPANEILNFEFANASTPLSVTGYRFTIVNTFGQIIREEELIFNEGKANINVMDLINGIYFVTINNDANETIIKKLLVAK